MEIFSGARAPNNPHENLVYEDGSSDPSTGLGLRIKTKLSKVQEVTDQLAITREKTHPASGRGLVPIYGHFAKNIRPPLKFSEFFSNYGQGKISCTSKKSFYRQIKHNYIK